MRALDTSPEAAAIQERLHQALGPEGRLVLAMKMSDLARELAKAGLRERNPGVSEDELIRRLARRLHGR